MTSQQPESLPEPLREALDALERELYSVSLARLLKRQQLSPATAQVVLRGLKAYLTGDTDEAIQQLEAVSEELRDLTVQLPGQ